jgi:iron complex transport system permease protein
LKKILLKKPPFKNILPLLVFIVGFISLGMGKYPIAPGTVFEVLLHPEGARQNLPLEYQVIWTIRLPRLLTAFCAGAGLALCGAALQGVFHNPLVDPHVIGVTSGAAFGGALAILLGASGGVLMLCAFGFGMGALVLVYALAGLLKQESNLILVLAGLILNGFFSALVSMIQYLADTETKLPNIVFWLMGSFANADWPKTGLFALAFLPGTVLLLRLRWRINVLSLGSRDAKALDRNAAFAKPVILTLCALIVSAQVAVSGSIGWIGLVIPHLARIVGGFDHRAVLPTAMLLGGGFMILVDDCARMLSSAEIPLGIITAVLGAPFFTVLLLRTRKI